MHFKQIIVAFLKLQCNKSDYYFFKCTFMVRQNDTIQVYHDLISFMSNFLTIN